MCRFVPDWDFLDFLELDWVPLAAALAAALSAALAAAAPPAEHFRLLIARVTLPIDDEEDALTLDLVDSAVNQSVLID